MNKEQVEKNVARAIKQSPYGQMRLCELELIGMVSARVKGYCCIGCGQGYEMKFVKCQHKLGIDINPGRDFPHLCVNIFDKTGSFNINLIRKLIDWSQEFKGSVLWYTDNGNKVKEIEAITKFCVPGDIVGTHNFGTEVPFSMMEEMEKKGFAPMDEYDKYIRENYCLCYFWEKL